VKARELFEDSLEHELLSQSECLHLGKGHIVELRSLGTEYVVIANVPIVDAASGNESAFVTHVLRALELLVLDLLVAVAGGQVTIVCNSPLALKDEVNFCYVSLFHQDISIFLSVFELAGHKSESDFIHKV
jgi:hypothetical protein